MPTIDLAKHEQAFFYSNWKSSRTYVNTNLSFINTQNFEKGHFFPQESKKFFFAEIVEAEMEAKHHDQSNFSMKSKNIYIN